MLLLSVFINSQLNLMHLDIIRRLQLIMVSFASTNYKTKVHNYLFYSTNKIVYQNINEQNYYLGIRKHLFND